MLRGTMARAKSGQTITKTRGFLYLLAKFLGDFQAAREGRVGKRVALRDGRPARGWGRSSNNTREATSAGCLLSACTSVTQVSVLGDA